MTTLYALGKLEQFEEVFDIPAYHKAFPQRLGFVLANKENHLYQETLKLLEDRKIEIPQMAYVCEEQFRRAMKNLKETQV